MVVALLKGELILTLNIAAGVALGALLLRSGAVERLLKLSGPFFGKLGIAPAVIIALGVSVGSSRAGAALLAASLDEGVITERTAKWGTLMLAFPAYLRRWPATIFLAAGMAGFSGAVFASTLLLRSAARFAALTFVLRKEKGDGRSYYDGAAEEKESPGPADLFKKLRKTLPLAWVFYAAAFIAAPPAENLLSGSLGGYRILPLSDWAVAAASVSHVSASLALAGGSLASGELSAAQAVFALLVGNSLGVVTRAVRQNAGYYFGLFSKELARQMLFLSVATQVPFILVTLLLAALPLI